jgi:hypothetical protein
MKAVVAQNAILPARKRKKGGEERSLCEKLCCVGAACKRTPSSFNLVHACVKRVSIKQKGEGGKLVHKLRAAQRASVPSLNILHLQ